MRNKLTRVLVQFRRTILLTATLVGLAVPAIAHHSHAQYDMVEFTHLEGTVAEFHLLNPHAWVYLSVEGNDGEPEIWALEAAGAGGLRGMGIGPNTISVGETVSVRCHRLLDDSNGCLLGYITGADGVERLWD